MMKSKRPGKGKRPGQGRGLAQKRALVSSRPKVGDKAKGPGQRNRIVKTSQLTAGDVISVKGVAGFYKITARQVQGGRRGWLTSGTGPLARPLFIPDSQKGVRMLVDR